MLLIIFRGVLLPPIRLKVHKKLVRYFVVKTINDLFRASQIYLNFVNLINKKMRKFIINTIILLELTIHWSINNQLLNSFLKSFCSNFFNQSFNSLLNNKLYQVNFTQLMMKMIIVMQHKGTMFNNLEINFFSLRSIDET